MHLKVSSAKLGRFWLITQNFQYLVADTIFMLPEDLNYTAKLLGYIGFTPSVRPSRITCPLWPLQFWLGVNWIWWNFFQEKKNDPMVMSFDSFIIKTSIYRGPIQHDTNHISTARNMELWSDYELEHKTLQMVTVHVWDRFYRCCYLLTMENLSGVV